MNLNKIFILGRLTANPESRTTPSGQSVTTIKMATNRVWNNTATGAKQEDTEFHTIIAWGKLGETASKYLLKGQMALFEGRIQTRSWQDQTGNKRYTTEIIAENLQLGPKPGAGMGGGTGAYSSSYAKPATSAPSAPYTPKTKASSPAEDEIPVINEDMPIANNPTLTDTNFQETEIDLKDIPF